MNNFDVQNGNVSYSFWKNQEIVDRYANGANVTQTNRYFQASGWLAENPIQVGETLVDIGCGTGVITSFFAVSNAAGNVYGVDYSPAMIRAAEKTVRKFGVNNVSLWNADAMDFSCPAKEGGVDRMISFTAIHWFSDISKFFTGIEKYLKPGGVFFFRYAGCEGDETLVLAEKMRKEEKWIAKFEHFSNPMYTYSTEKMRQEITKVKMGCKKASIWENTEEFPDRDEYKKYVSGWLPHLCFLDSQEDRNEFLKELVDRHCSRRERCDENGRVTVTDTQVEIWGYKSLDLTSGKRKRI